MPHGRMVATSAAMPTVPTVPTATYGAAFATAIRNDRRGCAVAPALGTSTVRPLGPIDRNRWNSTSVDGSGGSRLGSGTGTGTGTGTAPPLPLSDSWDRRTRR